MQRRLERVCNESAEGVTDICVGLVCGTPRRLWLDFVAHKDEIRHTRHNQPHAARLHPLASDLDNCAKQKENYRARVVPEAGFEPAQP